MKENDTEISDLAYSKAFKLRDVKGINKAIKNAIVAQVIETRHLVIISYREKTAESKILKVV